MFLLHVSTCTKLLSGKYLPLEIKNVAGNKKKFKIALKKIYTLIHFTPWESTLVNRKLRTVLQNFYVADIGLRSFDMH